MKADISGPAEAVAAEIASRLPPAGMVLLIGGVDTGKTTLARALHRLLGGEVVDADLGQSAIGPPTVIARGTYDEGMRDGYFVGDITPRGHLLRSLCGAKRMAREARRPAVVDTDGFISGPAGRAYKLALIEALEPDLVVFLHRGEELALLRAACDAPAVSARIAGVRPKRREERAAAREASFRRAFSRGSDVRVRWGEVRWRASLLGIGEILDPNDLGVMLGCRVLFARRLGDEAVAVIDGKPLSAGAVRSFLGLGELHLIPKSYLEDRLIGCFRGGRFVGIGRIASLDREGLSMLVPGGDSPEEIQLGCLRVTAAGRELGRSLIP